MTDDRTEEERLADQEKHAHDELHRAHRASQILEDDLFKEAIAAIRGGFQKDFEDSDLNDDDTRRNARIGIEILTRILRALKHHVDTGKMAQVSLSEIEQRRSFLQRLKRSAA